MKEENCNCKAKLDYPCRWLYKVIGEDQEDLRAAFAEIIGSAPCTISHSNSSRKGRYHCLNLELTVHSEKQRNDIYMALKSHAKVKIVL